MIKEKKILSYFIGWLILGYIICFIGINNVFAEEIKPTEIKSQIRTIYTDGTTQWYTSGNNTYSTPLYFGTGPSYSTYGIPCNFRLLVVDNINSSYSYKYSYDMHIFTPYSTSNTWDSSKIDSKYDIRVGDDQGVVKDSKCTVINTTKNTNSLGTFMNKSISCVFTVNKSQSNTYISAGYFCKGNCNLENLEPLGFIPQDSYMSIDNVKIERFNDNSNIIIDQNQTIIDQNNTTNEKLDDVQQSIIDSNKETQDVIKDQFNECRPSYNLLNVPSNYKLTGNQSISIELDPGTYTLSAESIETSGNYSQFRFNFEDTSLSPYYVTLSPDKLKYTFTLNSKAILIRIYSNDSYSTSENTTTTFNKLMLQKGSVATKYEKYGENICSNRLDETNNQLGDLNNSLNNSDSSVATNDASNFFSNFTTDTFGLTSIITAPLSLINSLTSSSCSTLRLPLPYLDNEYIELPCMNSIYSRYFGSFFDIYQTITFGIVAYWVIVRIYNQVKDFKNPDHDEIEVLDL